MIDKITAIVLLRKTGQVETIFGAPLADEIYLAWQDMLQSRPAARKDGGGFVVAVPLHKPSDADLVPSGQVWAVWQMDYVPPVLDLPRVLSTLADMSRGFVNAARIGAGAALHGDAAIGAQPDFTLAAIETALADLPARRRRNVAILTQRLAALLTHSTGCASVAAVAIRSGHVRQIWVSDDRLKPVLGQLRAFYSQQIRDGRDACRVEVTSESSADFEAGLLLHHIGASSLDLHFPTGDTGYGWILLNAQKGDHAAVMAAASAVVQLSQPLSVTPLLTKNRKNGLLAAAAIIAAWLLWPAPTWLTVTGTSLPDATLTVALSTDATLQQMFVRVGAHVEKGAPIAQLFSAQLEERRSQEELSIKVEELAANAAMSENNFGAFQLAKQRGEIAKTRLAQVVARIDQLKVTAPASGLIVAAVPDNTKGAALTQGTKLAEVQVSPKFLVRLNPARVDARILAVGQTGKIYFRGLSDRTYDVRLITPPVATLDSATRTEKLEAYAQVITPDDGRLMGGLSGYARIAGPRQLRILSLTRYLREYIRVTAWNYLGLPL